jgi:hypothetical protein
MGVHEKTLQGLGITKESLTFSPKEIPHFLTAEIPHYKTKTAPKNSPCFSIRVRQYHLSYFYALYVIDLAVPLDEEEAIFDDLNGDW